MKFLNLVGLFLSLSSLFCFQLAAQELQKPAGIKKTIEELKGSEDGEKEAAVWKKVLEFHDRLTASKGKTSEHIKERAQIENNHNKLKEKQTDREVELPPKSIPLKELEAKTDEFSRLQDESELEAKRLNKLSQVRDVRIGELPGLITAARSKLAEVQPLDQAASSSVAIERAQYQLDLIKKQYYSQRIKELEAELSYITEAENSLQLKKKIAEKNEVYYTEAEKAWTKRLENARKVEVVNKTDEVAKLVERYRNIPELKSIAEANLELLDTISGKGVSEDLSKAAERALFERREDLRKLEERSDYSKKRIKLLEDSNLTIDEKTGSLLRLQAASLPSLKGLKSDLKKVSEQSTKNQLKLYDLLNMLERQPSNTEEFINQLQKKLDKEGIPSEEVRQLFKDQRSLINSLRKKREELAENQESLIKTLNETIIKSEAYRNYLDERLIWIASAGRVGSKDLVLELDGITKIVSDGYISKNFNQLKRDLVNYPLIWGIFIVLLAFLLVKQKRLREVAQKCHQQAKKRNCQSIYPTLKGGLLGMVSVLVLPLLFGFLAWRVQATSLFVKPLFIAAVFSYLASLAWVYSRPTGFLQSNFKISDVRCKIIHDTLKWFLPIMLPLLFLSVCLVSLPEGKSHGRILFMISLALLLIALHQLFKPSKNLICRENSSKHLAKFVYLLCMLFCSGLIIATFLGYFTSALLIREQFVATIWTVVASLFVASLLRRWFLVSSRKIAIKQALARREQLMLEREKAKNEDSSEVNENTKTLEEVEAEAVNLAGVKEQTSRLVNVALYCTLVFSILGIWSQSVQALSILDKTELWRVNAPIEASGSGETTISNPLTDGLKSATSGGDKSSDTSNAASVNVGDESELPPGVRIISLQDLLITLIIFVLTYIAASNVPGLLEITLFDRMNFQTGAAFALKTTIRYLIVLLGIIWGFSNIGITWSNIQWIAAAVTLGIGFGLQEVFANFVAGIILLYERPIRLGDIITVGEVSGKVTEIKIRATTVLQFNNHELIVPNKEFITGQLINWTLRDNVIRAEVAVGIAYGSDTAKAKEIMLKIAKDHKRVLETPGSDVVFKSFGASSLDFLLRFHVAGFDDLVRTQSDLHFEVDNAFREAEIEISFPQQDVHIRSIDAALPVNMTAGKD